MKKFATFALLVFSCLIFGQDNSFLETKNGFRTIKLGTSADQYPEFKLKNEANLELFKLSMNFKTTHVYKGNANDKIKTGRILFIYLITDDKNIITEIRVVTEKVLSVYSTLQNAYGKPTDSAGTKLIWRTDHIECSIEGENNQLPGYHIRYKSISNDRQLIYGLMKKTKAEAQAEL